MLAQKRSKFISSLLVNGALAVVCLLWTIPTIGLLVSSFRDRIDINTTGWWTVFPHRDWVESAQLKPDPGVDRNGPMTIGGVTATFEEFQKGITSPSGQRLTWVGNRRIGYVAVEEQHWTANANFNLQNYQQVLATGSYTAKLKDGTTDVQTGNDMGQSFLNSLAVTIPSTVIPISLARVRSTFNFMEGPSGTWKMWASTTPGILRTSARIFRAVA